MRLIAGFKYSREPFESYVNRVRFSVVEIGGVPLNFDIYTDDTLIDNVVDIIVGLCRDGGKEVSFQFSSSRASDDACADMISEMFD